MCIFSKNCNVRSTTRFSVASQIPIFFQLIMSLLEPVKLHGSIMCYPLVMCLFPGRMRCLAALARWEELSALCREQWTAAEPAARLEMAPMVCHAA